MKNRPVLDADDCARISAAAQAEALRNGWAVAIAILDDGGNLLHFVRLDGASAGSVDISQGKARTAAMTRRASKSYEELIASGRLGVMSLGLVTVQGGVPIIVGDHCLGAVGVSGAASDQDEQVARVGIAALGGATL